MAGSPSVPTSRAQLQDVLANGPGYVVLPQLVDPDRVEQALFVRWRRR